MVRQVLLSVCLIAVTVCEARPVPCRRAVKANHVGYNPAAPKVFMIRDPLCRRFEIHTIDPDVRWKKVFEGELHPVEGRPGLFTGDFSELKKPADYRIVCATNEVTMVCSDFRPDGPEGQWSHSFVIKPDAYATVERMIANFFTWQRCGSKKGWAGECHRDLVTLYGTDRKIDLSGGYHQSGDLRGWAEGISLSFYGYLRWAEMKKPLWDDGIVEEELRWALDYFLKAVGPEGYAYDSHFAPIGWGPRDYYPVPAPMPGQCNIVMLFSRAARYFRVKDTGYAERMIATARRMIADLQTNPAYDVPYKPMVDNLPAGSQVAIWWQSRRTTGNSIAALAMAALEFYRATGEKRYADLAKKYGRSLLSRQFTDGPFAGAFRQEEGVDELSFVSGSYGHLISGWRTAFEFDCEFPDEPEWRKSAMLVCDHLLKMWKMGGGEESVGVRARSGEEIYTEEPFRAYVVRGNSASSLMRTSILFNQAARRYGRRDLIEPAQRMIDFVLGANPQDGCYVNGAGYNHFATNVFGQFFPSTPAIPGGFAHKLAGEYDMPPAGLALWAFAEAAR